MSEVEDRISWFQQMIAALAGKCTELECKEVSESKKWDTSGLCCVKLSRCSRQAITQLTSSNHAAQSQMSLLLYESKLLVGKISGDGQTTTYVANSIDHR